LSGITRGEALERPVKNPDGGHAGSPEGLRYGTPPTVASQVISGLKPVPKKYGLKALGSGLWALESLKPKVFRSY
jgi:hypothetical protein